MGEVPMTNGNIASAAVAATLIWGLPAHAQVALDVTKVTCEQFAAYKITIRISWQLGLVAITTVRVGKWLSTRSNWWKTPRNLKTTV